MYMSYSRIIWPSQLSKFVEWTKDVTPWTFEAAIQFQQNLVAARSMTALEAMTVIEFYHVYKFTEGIALCDDVLADYFCKNAELDFFTPPEDLDLLVDAAAMAHRLDLPKSKIQAILYLPPPPDSTNGMPGALMVLPCVR